MANKYRHVKLTVNGTDPCLKPSYMRTTLTIVRRNKYYVNIIPQVSHVTSLHVIVELFILYKLTKSLKFSLICLRY